MHFYSCYESIVKRFYCYYAFLFPNFWSTRIVYATLRCPHSYSQVSCTFVDIQCKWIDVCF
jgi:hypothetical protein